MSETCEFVKAWVGRCKEHPNEGYRFCPNHLREKCSRCGKQAVKTCEQTSSLVCGQNLCEECVCWCREKQKIPTESDRLRAENKKLREALERVGSFFVNVYEPDESGVERLIKNPTPEAVIAQQALKEVEK